MITEINYKKNTQFKRFIYFGIYYYYPNGGLEDARVTAETLEEIVAWKDSKANKDNYDDWYIFDTKELKVVMEKGRNNEI